MQRKALGELQPQRVILYVDHAGQDRGLGIRRVEGEAEHEFVGARPQQRRRELELVAEVLAHDAAPHAARPAAVRRDDPGLDVLPVHRHRVGHVRVRLARQRRPLVVAVGRLGAREVDGERCPV